MRRKTTSHNKTRDRGMSGTKNNRKRHVNTRKRSRATRKRGSKKNNGAVKLRKTTTLAQFENEVVVMFLDMLNTVKLYHWKTYSYATHKATDELHEKLEGHVDRFVEVLLGKATTGPGAGHGRKGARISLKSVGLTLRNDISKAEFKKKIDAYKSYLVGLDDHPAMRRGRMTNSDLFTIRDEILADLNQFLYLYTFK